jgi:hypothetical protein
MASKLVLGTMMLSIIAMLATSAQSFAIDENTVKATDEIKNNPSLMNMLKKIELSKKILAEMQEKTKAREQKTLQMQEVRKTAEQALSSDLEKMRVDNEQFTPTNAFAKFVSKKPTHLHDIYWSMFNYQQEKTNVAKDIRDKILANGGTWGEASNAYNTISATNRVKLIELNKNFNIKYGNADSYIQNTFDSNGKLPRTN